MKETREVDPTVYEDALTAFLDALGIDAETAFAVDVKPDRAVVQHVAYTQKDNGVMSGDFWEDVISRASTDADTDDGQDD